MVVNRHNDEAPGTILCAPLVGCASVNGILRAMFDRQMERWAPPQPGNRALLVGVAVVVAFALLFLLRPTLLEKVRSAPGYRSSLQRMVGSTGHAMTAISGRAGEVKGNGEVWQARSFGDVEIEAGAPVEIFEVDGITVVVYPKEP